MSAYVGYPDRFLVDTKSNFASNEFRILSKNAGIEVSLSSIHSNDTLGVGDRFHGPLRRSFMKIVEDVPCVNHGIALKLSVKATNDTMDPEELVPSLLVFGTLPRFSPDSSELLNRRDRMESMNLARVEMADMVAEQIVKGAARSKLPPATKYKVSPGT